MQQVKIRIYQPWVLQNRLKLMGAVFLGTWVEKDAYFLQPAGSFLKIKRMRDHSLLVKLRKDGEGKFRKEAKLLRNPEKKEKELTDKFGLVNVIEKRVRTYKYGGFTIRLQSIGGLGDFLIIESRRAETKPLLKKLGIEKPEFVSLAFSEML